MNLVDIGIWAILLIFAVKGFLRGLVREVCSLIGLVAGGWAAFSYYHSLAGPIRRLINLPPAVTLSLAFIAIFLGTVLLFHLLGHLVTAIFKIMLLGGLNRIGGVIFGILAGAFLLCLVFAFASGPRGPAGLRTYLERSGTSRAFSSAGREIIAGWDVTASSAEKRDPAGLPGLRQKR